MTTPEQFAGTLIDGPTTVRRSGAIAALATALAKAQGELKNPAKDSVNPHFKSRYADLAAVRDAVTPVLHKHGLAVLQLPCEMGDAPALVSLLLHTSGEWVETTMRLRPQKSDPQGVGSALTYARRYALQSIAGVAAEDDDDGNAASRPAKPQQQPERRAEPARQPDPQPAGEPEKVTTGDPITDAAAMTALLARKGYGWAGMIESLNKRYSAKYHVGRTKWLDIPRNQRAGAVEGIRKLPDKPTETPDSVAALLNEWATAAGSTFDSCLFLMCGKLGVEAACLDDLNADHLRAAATFAREQIGEAKK